MDTVETIKSESSVATDRCVLSRVLEVLVPALHKLVLRGGDFINKLGNLLLSSYYLHAIRYSYGQLSPVFITYL